MSLAVHHLWLIPALPLLAAAVGALTPRTRPRLAATLAIGAIALAFLISCSALVAALQNPSAKLVANFTWFSLGPEATAVRLGLLLDPLTALLCVMVTFIGTLIFVFSLGYMRDDANAARFFCFLSFFAAAMLGLLIANSLLLLFICWELVGLASYLLIGFWFEKPAAAAAAKKAFLTTRIGDLGLLLGMLWLYNNTDTLLFYDAGLGILEDPALMTIVEQTTVGGLAVSTAIGLLLFCGAIGKSGQFPLHVWLPVAMEGPTPVSALIHAATMVAAGVFLIARTFPIFVWDQAQLILHPNPGLPFDALTIVAFVGAITALLGALIAVAQNDLKRILAFSTISQLGYMMLSLGVGSWIAAIFHLITHAFFKALLFLGAGSVIHATHHEQDIRRLGGLRGPLRITFATFAIGTMALTGVPFFSGFWSKEDILHHAHAWDVSSFPFYAGLIAAGLTAFYMARLLAQVFFGAPRSAAASHAHESPRTMTVPLLILGFCAVAVGFLGTPAWTWLQFALSPESKVEPVGYGLMALSTGLVALGFVAGWALYGHRPRTDASAPDPLATRSPVFFAALAQRLGFDALYAATFGRLNDALAAAADAFDRHVVDGVVRFLARLGEFTGLVNRDTDDQLLNGGFDATSDKLRETGVAYSRAQTGQPHGYLRTVALGFAVITLVVLLGGVR